MFCTDVQSHVIIDSAKIDHSLHSLTSVVRYRKTDYADTECDIVFYAGIHCSCF